MNSDLLKIRESRLFRPIHDAAFDRITKYLKVRAFGKGEKILRLDSEKNFQKYVGYVITGRVLFLSENERPLGLAMKDEFFLGRSYDLGEQEVRKLVSGHEHTLVVFVPKAIIETITEASSDFADMIEEIYDSIYERANMIMSDAQASKHFEEWLEAQDSNKTLSSWLGQLDKRKAQVKVKQKKKKQNTRFSIGLWILGVLLVLLVAYESGARYLGLPLSLTGALFGADAAYDPGSDYNIAIGIIGFSFLILTLLHTGAKFAIKKLKWKVNYRYSQQLHMFFGIVGGIYIVFHSAGHFTGGNVAHWALYAMGIGLLSGLVGQLISIQIPTSIRGEKLKLDTLKKEQVKLSRKAELLMDDDQYKTSVALISKDLPSSFWGSIFAVPLVWLKRYRVRTALKSLGMGRKSAGLAASYLGQEFRMRQKIRMLEIANLFFKRWMMIHRPFGYALYILGGLHVIIVMVLS